MSKEPSNLAAELALIGAAIISHDALLPIVSTLEEEDFYNPKNKIIFSAIKKTFDSKRAVNLMLVLEQLDNDKNLDSIGGFQFIKDLTEQVTYVRNYQENIALVKDKSLMRQLIKCGDNISKNWESQEYNVGEYLADAEKSILEITRRRKIGSFSTAEDITKIIKEKSKLTVQEQEKMKGIPSGFADIDRILAGFQKGELIILAARPSVGKTALALNFAFNAASLNKSVAIFSLEMSSLKIMERMLAAASNIPGDRFKNYRFESELEVGKFDKALRQLAKMNIYIDDTSHTTLSDIYSKARKLDKVDMIIIDYIGLIASTKKIDRHLEIAEYSRGLKALARELDIPVIVLSQLSRDVEKRSTTNKRPNLSDLRDSGSIEQDADVAMLMYREDYYKTNEISEGSHTPNNITEINIAKNRNGEIGMVKLYFFKDLQKFANFSEKEEI